jgi:hypothetical protein
MIGETRGRFRSGWLLPVAIVVGCCGVPFLGVVVWFEPGAHRDLTGTVAGRLLLTVLGLIVLGAGAALGVGAVRILGVRWMARLTGERTTARVTGKRPETDLDGDVSWTVWVEGISAAGFRFAEDVPHGWREPPDVGTTVPVRYGRRIGVILVRRTVGGVVEAVVTDAFIVLVAVAGLYTAGAIAYGLVAIWR